ncbi:MAG: flavodoxin domain-containing protein [Treponema sp.]|nr:flavodoxin domain-containing protein [Treponema sp.]
MRTIIFYATKNGAAAEVAARIASKIEGAVLHNLKQSPFPSFEDFDCVIIGSSVYAGMILKETKRFLSQNAGKLRQRKLGLFICGMSTKEDNTTYNNNFSQDILQTAKAKSHLGGIFDPKKAGTFERFIIKLVTKKSEYVNTIDDSKIEEFVKEIKS